MARHATLRSLFVEAASDAGVLAVATWGETKSKLRPQVCVERWTACVHMHAHQQSSDKDG
jgi:hypothetical protein